MTKVRTTSTEEPATLPISFPEAAILLVSDGDPRCPFRLTKQRGLWERDCDTARDIIEGLRSSNLYPNIHTILHLFMITPPEPSYRVLSQAFPHVDIYSYIEVHFTIALLDYCVRYDENDTFTVILAGLKKIVPYSEDFII